MRMSTVSRRKSPVAGRACGLNVGPDFTTMGRLVMSSRGHADFGRGGWTVFSVMRQVRNMAKDNAASNPSQQRMENIVSLAKRRGFVFPSSEVYGGLNGCWDYGPLGVELKRNVKDAWYQSMVRERDDIVPVDCAILMNRRVWQASGHEKCFTDPMVDCRECKKRFRADKVRMHYVVRGKDQWDPATHTHRFPDILWHHAYEGDAEEDFEKNLSKSVRKSYDHVRNNYKVEIEAGNVVEMDYLVSQVPSTAPYLKKVCPECSGELTEARLFNLMFKTFVGPAEDSAAMTYLRPETAQGIFVNFLNVLNSSRIKVPFGIAQIGKAFRNEITPRNFTFRTREFEQMEIEFFCKPGTDDEWYRHWVEVRKRWYLDLGMQPDNVRFREHAAEELAHYARGCTDVEYKFPFGWGELEGIANRTDYDLKAHAEASGKDMTYFDDETKERFVPYVIEPSAGADRSTLAFLCDAYCEDEAPDEKGN
ncbi:MAG: glycine--tRNA ligase, partial [Sedimentisphaerales bacterium]|nr:glycine--tRNA ligase [Sedimentisphaerales bacterium]